MARFAIVDSGSHKSYVLFPLFSKGKSEVKVSWGLMAIEQ